MSTLGQRAQELYARLRPTIETPDNLGKLVVMDVVSGDYEIDAGGIESSRRLQARHPEAALYALRIGYKAVESLGGILERTEACWSVVLVAQAPAKIISGGEGDKN